MKRVSRFAVRLALIALAGSAFHGTAALASSDAADFYKGDPINQRDPRAPRERGVDSLFAPTPTPRPEPRPSPRPNYDGFLNQSQQFWDRVLHR